VILISASQFSCDQGVTGRIASYAVTTITLFLGCTATNAPLISDGSFTSVGNFCLTACGSKYVIVQTFGAFECLQGNRSVVDIPVTRFNRTVTVSRILHTNFMYERRLYAVALRSSPVMHYLHYLGLWLDSALPFTKFNCVVTQRML
jgi:hypothetical protein